MKTIIATTLAFCLLMLTACGSAKAPEARPDDFRIDYRWSTGAIAPPDGYSLSILIEPNGRGTAIMQTEAEDGAKQIWQETFDVPAKQLDAAYELMRGSGALDGAWDKGEEAAGSETASMLVTLGGKEIKVAGIVAADKQKAANALFGSVRALAAPAEVKLEAQRQIWLQSR